jgi:hyaluronan synthase
VNPAGSAAPLGQRQGDDHDEETPEAAPLRIVPLVSRQPDPRPKLAPFRPFDESTAALPERLHETVGVRIAIRAIQAVAILYAILLLYWVWLAKDAGLAAILADPVFYGYSILVTVYVVTRFLLAPLYRPTPDTGYRPSVSIVIPAFNEEGCIEATIDACYSSEYPPELLEVVVVDDGSSDATWERILAARERNPSVVCVQFPENRGKRAAMAEGIRRSSGEICVFIDSDSVVEPGGLARLVADFADTRVGAVVGHADVMNKTANWLTRMQQVRYYVAFRVIKGSESLFGAVTCASGCFSAYRRTALLAILDRWENQEFLGRKATFGDDRALTNYVLRDWRVTYQSEARSHTLAPETMRVFGRQQLRWKKSWLRESLHVSKFIWRKHPVAAALTMMGVLFPWVAPLVVLHSVWFRAVGDGSPLFYLMGAYVMAVLYSLYYAVSRRSPLWWHGVTFVLLYMVFLVWQTYYALFTIRNTKWGTRASTHSEGGGEVVVVGPVAREQAS